MEEKRRFYHSLVFPVFFLLVIWTIKITEASLDISLAHLGLFPLKAGGLQGIFFSPLIHADFKHLFDNSIPLFFLSLAIFYFYRPVAYRVFFLIWFISGVIIWFLARPAYHIGASGLVYGFASFLFLSGIIRKNINLLAISLLVVFLYGGLIWGIFPYDFRVSWESHLIGGITGLGIALYYRRYGPPPSRKILEDEDIPPEEYGGSPTNDNSRSEKHGDTPVNTELEADR